MLKIIYSIFLLVILSQLIMATSIEDNNLIYEYSTIIQDELSYTIIQTNDTCFDFYAHIYNESVVDDPNYKWKFTLYDDSGNKTLKEKLKKEDIGMLIDFCVNESDYKFTFKFGQSSTTIDASANSATSTTTGSNNHFCVLNDSYNVVYIGNSTDAALFLGKSYNNGSTWTTKLVDTSATISRPTILCNLSEMKLIYFDSVYAGYKLRHSTNGTSFSTAVNLLTSTGTYQDWALDSNNNIHGCIINSTNADSYYYNVSDYIIINASAGSMSSCTICLDKDNNVYLYSYEYNNPESLFLSTNSNGKVMSATHRVIETSGVGSGDSYNPDCSINQHGFILVSYANTTGAELELANSTTSNPFVYTQKKVSTTFGSRNAITINSYNQTAIIAQNAATTGAIQIFVSNLSVNFATWTTIQYQPTSARDGSLWNQNSFMSAKYEDFFYVIYTHSSDPKFENFSLYHPPTFAPDCPALGLCNTYGVGTYIVAEYCQFRNTNINHLGDILIVSPCGTLDLDRVNLTFTGKLTLMRNVSDSTYQSRLIINNTVIRKG